MLSIVCTWKFIVFALPDSLVWVKHAVITCNAHQLTAGLFRNATRVASARKAGLHMISYRGSGIAELYLCCTKVITAYKFMGTQRLEASCHFETACTAWLFITQEPDNRGPPPHHVMTAMAYASERTSFCNWDF